MEAQPGPIEINSLLKNMDQKTLHEWMCFKAETVVRYNWSDVAVHDRRIVERMLPMEFYVWCIHETGSAIFPMHCQLETRSNHSAITTFLLALLENRQHSALQEKFYFIAQGRGDYDYITVHVDSISILNFVFCGQWATVSLLQAK